MLSAANQEHIFELQAEKCIRLKTLKKKWCHLLVWWKLKIFFSTLPPSLSITTIDIFEKILHHWWFNGLGQGWFTKINIMSSIWHWMQRVELKALPCLVGQEALHLRSNMLHVCFRERKRQRERERWKWCSLLRGWQQVSVRIKRPNNQKEHTPCRV